MVNLQGYLMSDHLPSLHASESEYVSIRSQGGLYIDKTHYFAHLLAPGNKYLFLARPRRFGKTLLLSTLEAYFQGVLPKVRPIAPSAANATAAAIPAAALFVGTALQGADPLQPVRPVIRLDMSTVAADTAGELRTNLLLQLEDVYTKWYQRGVNMDLAPTPETGTIQLGTDVPPAQRLGRLIMHLAQHYGQRPVVLVDEYDAPITHLMGRDIAPDPILATLRNFYVVLKANEQSLHFVFVTGVSRFAHVTLFSAFNNLRDITWNPLYANLCGFTEQEVQTLMYPYLEVGAAHLGWRTADLLAELRDHYNGYRFKLVGQAENLYNPFSLCACLHGLQHRELAEQWKQLGWPNFWAESGTPEFLIRLVKQGRYTLSAKLPALHSLDHATYDLNRLDYPTLMLQTGYYTLRGDDVTTLHLAYPNREVSLTYAENLMALYTQEMPDYHTLRGLHAALQEGKYDTFCRRLTAFFAGIPGEKLQNESDYHLVLHALCQLMQIDFRSEPHEWSGRPDMVLAFPDHVCVIELKYRKTAAEALNQIEEKAYGRGYMEGNRRVVGLGLNFASGADGTAKHIQHTVTELYRPVVP